MNKYLKKTIPYLRLMRFHKPIGILLLLWPTLWALWIAAQGKPKIGILMVFVLGVVLMRAAGCVINDVVDRHWDGYVARTKRRPLVTGEVSVHGAIILFIILLMLAFILVLTLNKLTIALAFIAAILAVIYPFLKRFTNLPQVGLGFAFSFGVPMAFAAQIDHVPLGGWVLFLATILWTIAYDTQYALADREDDLKIGVKSTAILFAQYDRLAIALIQLSMLMIFLWVGVWLAFSIWFYLGLLGALVLMIYQQYLIRDRNPGRCLRAFLNNNWVGLVIFSGIALQSFGHNMF
jgi:4-hydroxybenzoate polyprenyltransferase